LRDDDVILVIGEQRGGKLNRTTWEAVTAAQQLDRDIRIAIAGASIGGVASELANAAADFNFGLLIAETDPKVRPCRNYARAWKWTRQIRRRRITWLAGRHDEPGGSAGTVPKSSGPGSGNPKYQLAVAYYAARRK